MRFPAELAAVDWQAFVTNGELQAYAHMSIAGQSEQTEALPYVIAALELFDGFDGLLGRPLVQRQVTQSFPRLDAVTRDDDGRVALPLPDEPVGAVTVEWRPRQSSPWQSLDAVIGRRQPGPVAIVPAATVDAATFTASADEPLVRVQFDAGLVPATGGLAAVPADLRFSMLGFARLLYDYRDGQAAVNTRELGIAGGGRVISKYRRRPR